MFTFRRALAVAAIILACFLLLRNTYPTHSTPLARLTNSPKPTGSHADNRKILEATADSAQNILIDQSTPASAEAPSTVENNRLALTKKLRPQVSMQDFRAKTLRQQLSYAYPYDAEGKFPAYIWQTWKYTPASSEFQDEWRPSEASWTELHPSFVHEVITDSVAVALIRHLYASIPEIQEAYDALPAPVLKADFFRYLILLARGGIYTDIDTTALKSAVEWVPADVPRSSYGLVIGIEADPNRPDWNEWYSRRIQFCQWTVQSKPGHPVLVDIIAIITEETLRRKRAHELDLTHMNSVVEFTGPALWTDVIFNYFNNPDYFDMTASTANITWKQFTGISEAKKVGDVVVLPITSFSPGVGQMGAGEVDDLMAFVHHTFQGSWKPESERHIGEKEEAEAEAKAGQ